jgi:hypothetical protein
MIDRNWGAHSKLHISLTQSSTNRVNDVIGSQTRGRHLIKKWQESLEVMAINDNDIGFTRKCASSR